MQVPIVRLDGRFGNHVSRGYTRTHEARIEGWRSVVPMRGDGLVLASLSRRDDIAETFSQQCPARS